MDVTGKRVSPVPGKEADYADTYEELIEELEEEGLVIDPPRDGDRICIRGSSRESYHSIDELDAGRCRDVSNNEVRRRLEERFHEWALNDFQREVAEDFPFLRRVAWSIPMKVIAIMRPLPLEARQQLASTRVKSRRVCINSEEVAKTWTADDERMRAWYQEQLRQPVREVLEAENLERWVTYIRDKRELMRAVREELMVVFPGEAPRKSKTELRFHTSVHGFEVETIVYAGHSWQLWYFHRLRHVPSGVDVSDISLVSWLGITTVTYWRYITEATIPEAAKTVGDLCRHFLAAADDFLAGLVDRFDGA